MNDRTLTTEEQRTLWDIAHRSLQHGLAHRKPWIPDLTALPAPLRAQRASFVTLQKKGTLRGCIGTLEAHEPLAKDVAENAFRAGFKDPRFPPVTAAEWSQLNLHISVLTVPEAIVFTSEQELLQQIQPFKDGLILEDQGRRATFIPSVWEDLPDPAAFVAHLKSKAGLSPQHGSPTLRAWRYTAESIHYEIPPHG